MSSTEPSRRGTHESAQRAPVIRTLEELEARAAQVQAEEREAIAALVHCIREIAVRCPTESRLPLELARAAERLSVYTHHGDADVGIVFSLGKFGLARDLGGVLPTASDGGS